MADKPIDQRVKDIVVEQLGVKPEQVTPQAKFIEDLGADSLDTVELVMAFEEEFGIEIPDEDAEKITRVKEAVEYIESHAKTKKRRNTQSQKHNTPISDNALIRISGVRVPTSVGLCC